VYIEAEGSPENLLAFMHDLTHQPPPLAQITSISSTETAVAGDTYFQIHPSTDTDTRDAHASNLICPDMGLCEDCRRELFDANDRRYRYPFINCTHCGPRYTIIEHLPYDRPYTAMHSFEMCRSCRHEYENPADRRFHAQPVACSACGPQVYRLDADGNRTADGADAIRHVIDDLLKGSIVAIKGLGGFHLSVNAIDHEAVTLLRRRKRRKSKPLALMVRDINAAHNIARFGPVEETLLKHPANPIILVRKKKGSPLSEAIAPDNDFLGIMLPGTPLHCLLLESDFAPLVMTSANPQGTPIYYQNEAAFEGLQGIADVFLMHDRDIYRRCDDSVVQVQNDVPRLMRRSRGYVPSPILLENGRPSILATGADLKNTVCLLQDDKAVLSPHIGNLQDHDTYRFFTETIDHLKRLFQIHPKQVACDLHPGFYSSRWARDVSGLPVIAVQHHHAHLAACLAENRCRGPAIGIILDGTGYGTDGAVWGGEILIGDFSGFQRFAHLEYMPLAGGESAIAAPWKIAVAYLYQTFGNTLPELPFLADVNYRPLMEAIEKELNVLPTSSCGRLFDAVATICGGKSHIDYEGQAAIEFMHAAHADDNDIFRAKPFDYALRKGEHQALVMTTRGILQEVVQAVQNEIPTAIISRKIHQTLIRMFTDGALAAREQSGIREIVLSGGVMQNHLLFAGLMQALKQHDFDVITHRQVPCNDGGLSLGQAMIGRNALPISGGESRRRL
jgi:hydrogenase maturation protein HypF